MIQRLITVLLLLLAVSPIEELEIDSSVTQLTPENYTSITGLPLTNNESKPDAPAKATTLETNWFIIFYHPACGHCRLAMPSWSELGKNVSKDPELSKKVRIGAVSW